MSLSLTWMRSKRPLPERRAHDVAAFDHHGQFDSRMGAAEGGTVRHAPEVISALIGVGAVLAIAFVAVCTVMFAYLEEKFDREDEL